MSAFSHIPVLFRETMEALRVRSDGIYVDCTVGGAGHASQILSMLGPGGRLIGIDRDADAIEAAGDRLSRVETDASYTLVRGNFHDIFSIMRELGVESVSGILADLGVSSYQLDTPSRGFSYHEAADLDMRMDASSGPTAADLVNALPMEDLARILRDYGEEKWAVQIARVICDRRKASPFRTAADLTDAVDAAIPAKVRRKDDGHPARRTFQALRIAVNDELDPLAQAVRDMVELLEEGGRVCVISFHSLEDRIVKNVFRELENPCTCPKSFPVCMCGKKPQVTVLTRKPVEAGEEEKAANPRSRSAKLRAAQKVWQDEAQH